MSPDRADELARVEQLASRDQHLAVVVTQGPDQAPQVSVVNAGIVAHPRDGASVVALVARGDSAKLRNLRARPRATLVFRAGWEWVAVRGSVDLAGPDDRHDWIDDEGIRVLLRDVFHAAGGQHDDLDEYDRVMAAERRTAVLVAPEHIWSNPTSAE
jgi:PPOX class probable F420-dependent enzyme